MKLKFLVDGESQLIRRADSENPVSDSQRFLQCEFIVSGMAGMICTPIFTRNGKSYAPIFQQTENDEIIKVICDVPHECIKPRSFSVSIFGYDENTEERITVNSEIIQVLQSGFSEGDTPEPPTPTVYEDILQKVANTELIAESLREDADNGRFDGEKGEPFTYEDLSEEQKRELSRADEVEDIRNGYNGIIYNSAGDAVRAIGNGKVDKIIGKGLSTRDYTTVEKEKLAGIETGANKTTIDTTLDSSSDNPISNSAVYNALSSNAKEIQTAYMQVMEVLLETNEKLENLGIGVGKRMLLLEGIIGIAGDGEIAPDELEQEV